MSYQLFVLFIMVLASLLKTLLYNFIFPTCRHFAFVPRKELVLILVNNHNAFAKNVVKSFQSSKFLLSSAKVAYFRLKRCHLLFGDLRTGGTGWLVVTYVTSAFISISGSLALWSELYLEIYLQNPPRENGNMGPDGLVMVVESGKKACP